MDYSDPALLKLAAKYTTVPDTTGLFQGPGFTMSPPQAGCGGQNSLQAVFQAGLAAGRVPAGLNPSGMLYSHGTYGLTLEAPNSAQCSLGCIATNPDPRNRTVKPLYAPSVYKLDNMPTINNVRGMY
jgi:hypothetical protein